jgi:NAD(P)-dependent dehydrogenase (short-subunit alcohol dehydrogenase family)
MVGIVEGKTVLITGGGGGIGRATALAFAREGARVAVGDYAGDAAAETAAMVKAAGGQAITIIGDVTRARDVETMLGDTIAAFGRLDCASWRGDLARRGLGATTIPPSAVAGIEFPHFRSCGSLVVPRRSKWTRPSNWPGT